MRMWMRRFVLFITGIPMFPLECRRYTLSVGKDNASKQSMTFQFNTDGGISVKTIHLLFFTASDDASGKFVTVLSLVGGATQEKLKTETKYVLPESASLDPRKAYHVMGIANLGGYVDDTDAWIAQWEGETESHFRRNAILKLLATNGKTAQMTHRSIYTAALPMNAFLNKPANESALKMTLTSRTTLRDTMGGIMIVEKSATQNQR